MQNDSIDNLRLDINKYKVRGCFYVRLGDTRARTIHITLANNGSVVDLTDVIIAELLIKKPDGAENDQAMVVYGNELQYTLRTQDINVAGECKCQIMLTYKDATVVTSPEFSVMVYEKEISQTLEKSTNEYTAITQQLVEVNNLAIQTANSAQIATDKRADIESYATTCETFYTQTVDEASNAHTDALNASASATNASASATNASASATASSISETNANTYATNAHTDALLAEGYKNVAIAQAELAKSYADEAEETAEGISDISAQVAQVKTYKEEAEQSASDALASENKAKTYETNASNYAKQCEDIAESFAGALIPKGTITFAQLSTVTIGKGFMWNISDEFTSDTRFNDGGGILYPVGTNVYVTDDLKFDCLAGSTVSGVKGSAETNYRKGNVSISASDIGIGTATSLKEGLVRPDGSTITINNGVLSASEMVASNVSYDKTGTSLDSTTVQTAISELDGKLGKGGSEVTQAQYDALPYADKMNGTEYFITDADLVSAGGIELTQAEYDALPASKTSDNYTYFITDSGNMEAKNIPYDDTRTQMGASNVQKALETQFDNLTSIVKSVTTDWIPLTFNNQSQVAINTISALTNGKVTDYTQIKGISVVSNGYINSYASSNNSIYAFITNLNAVTSNSYKIRLTIFY